MKRKLDNTVLSKEENKNIINGHFECPEEITSIGDWAFYRNNNLISITLHQGVISIGEYAFAESNLARINLPQGITSIKSYAFWFCNLVNINLPQGLKSIEAFAFYACSNLTSITLPQGLEKISQDAFDECEKLQCIFIDSNSDDEINRIRELLPKHLQEKVSPCIHWWLNAKEVLTKNFPEDVCNTIFDQAKFTFFKKKNDISPNYSMSLLDYLRYS